MSEFNPILLDAIVYELGKLNCYQFIVDYSDDFVRVHNFDGSFAGHFYIFNTADGYYICARSFDNDAVINIDDDAVRNVVEMFLGDL